MVSKVLALSMYRLLLYPCGGMHVHTHQKTALTSTVKGDKIAANCSTNDSTTTRVDREIFTLFCWIQTHLKPMFSISRGREYS